MSRKINRIIIHHSEGIKDTFESVKNWQTTKDNSKTPEIEGLGWAHVAYHYVIDQKGKIHRGASESISAGGTLRNSGDALEVCLCGNFDVQTPTPEALSRLHDLLTNWCKTYKIVPSEKSIVGHNDVQAMKKTKVNTCPGANLRSLLPQIRTAVHASAYANGKSVGQAQAI